MSISNSDAYELIAALLPSVKLESAFLYPMATIKQRAFIRAGIVFDIIRNSTKVPITEDEFDAFADGREER